jgi:hypothetical protein
MVKPLSRTACAGIITGLILYGAVICGGIGAGAGALVDSGRGTYGYISNFLTKQRSYSENRSPERNGGELVFTSSGAKVGAGLGAILFGVVGGVTTKIIRDLSRSKEKIS